MTSNAEKEIYAMFGQVFIATNRSGTRCQSNLSLFAFSLFALRIVAKNCLLGHRRTSHYVFRLRV